MKKVSQNVFRLVINILTLILFVKCSSTKYFSGFELSKKYVDTIAIYNPCVYLKSYNFNKQTNDSLASINLSKIISVKAKSILSNKYVINELKIPTNSILETDLFNLFSKLDTTQMKEYNIPGFIQSILDKTKERFCLMFFFQGFYSENLQPYENIIRGMQSNTLIIYSTSKPFRSDLRILIFDNLNKKLLYYNKNISKYDPRTPETIRQMIFNGLMSIYYK